jgi:ABC-type transport system involved in multi-copper enzyme maturation permease subunit
MTTSLNASLNTSLSAIRIRAVVTKELRDYRRNRFIATTMEIMPILFMIAPMVTIFSLPADAPSTKLNSAVGVSLLYLTLIPALVPAVVSSYTIVGEREQGTLEPVLTTPLRREELFYSKALATFLPTLAISYVMYGIFLACTGLFAHQNVANDVFQQLGTLASLPPLAVTALMGFGVISPTLTLALALGAALLLFDLAAGKLVSAMFDRERLITGTKA